MRDLAGVMPRLRNLILSGVKMNFPGHFGGVTSVTWDNGSVIWINEEINPKNYLKVKELRMQSSAFTSLPPVLLSLKCLEALDLCMSHYSDLLTFLSYQRNSFDFGNQRAESPHYVEITQQQTPDSLRRSL